MTPERSDPGGVRGSAPLIKDFGVTKKGGKNATYNNPYVTQKKRSYSSAFNNYTLFYNTNFTT